MSNQMLTLCLRFNLGHAATLDMRLLTRKSLFAARDDLHCFAANPWIPPLQAGFPSRMVAPQPLSPNIGRVKIPRVFYFEASGFVLKHTQRVELDQIAARQTQGHCMAGRALRLIRERFCELFHDSALRAVVAQENGQVGDRV